MKRQFFILLHLLILLALSACGVTTSSPSPMPSPAVTIQPSRLPDPDEVKALLIKLVDVEKRVPGIVVGMIAADPPERWVVGYGQLSATDERVPDGDTVFEIGSITKVFTGILLAQAVLNGEVKLDDPISMYLPEGVAAPEYEGRSITLLDLATHTSGLPESINPNSTIDQMYAYLSGYNLKRAPGSTFEYSNYGFGLLGDLLARIAGHTDYEALLLERIIRPLGMDSTRIVLTSDMESRLAPPHLSYSELTNSFNAPIYAGSGMIRSTANDMLTFLAANMGLTETELQPALKLANSPQRLIEGADYLGLGWDLENSDQGTHSKNGETGGYHSYLAWDPQRKIGVVVLANAAINIDDVGLKLVRGLPLTPVQVDPKVLAAYAGRYQFPGISQEVKAVVVTIRVDGTRIFMQNPRQEEYELLARSDYQFYPLEFDAEFTFYRNANSEVDRLVVVENGVTTEAKKVP